MNTWTERRLARQKDEQLDGKTDKNDRWTEMEHSQTEFLGS